MARTALEIKIEAPETPHGYTPSLLKKLFGAKSGPKTYSDHEGGEICEYKGDRLRPLFYDIRQQLKETIGDTDTATQAIWSYLDIDPIDYGLFSRNGQWVASFVFSGCAGMADVSQVVICHWLEQYEKKIPGTYSKIFKQHGLTLIAYDNFFDKETFIPFNEIGYAHIEKMEQAVDYGNIDVDQLWEYNPILFDGAVYESVEDMDAKILSFLKSDGLQKIPSQCKCKLCEPDFIPLSL